MNGSSFLGNTRPISLFLYIYISYTDCVKNKIVIKNKIITDIYITPLPP